jgi:protein-disulfide isomerase
MNKKTLFISTAIILVAVFITAITLFNNEKAKSNSVDNNNLTLLERTTAPVKGNEDAKVTIVEFFDPACGTCRQFYPLVNRIMKQHSGKVKLVKRYAPLHQGSDQVVKMLEAANLQGKFWPAVELLYKNQDQWVKHHVAQPDLALAMLAKIRLDPAQFTTDLQSSNVANAVMKDINDGKMLKVRATPQFFVNGKPLINFGYEPLVELVEEAIALSYGK